MNFIKRMVVKWVREDWDNSSKYSRDEGLVPISKSMAIGTRGQQSVDTDPTLHFKVFNAIGGKIVEFSRYDRKTDRHDHQVYIIGKDEDFGEKIAKISMLEVMKN